MLEVNVNTRTAQSVALTPRDPMLLVDGPREFSYTLRSSGPGFAVVQKVNGDDSPDGRRANLDPDGEREITERSIVSLVGSETCVIQIFNGSPV